MSEDKKLLKDLLAAADVQEGDKVWLIVSRAMPGGKIKMTRANYGFNLWELIGLTDSLKQDMMRYFESDPAKSPPMIIMNRILLRDEEEGKAVPSPGPVAEPPVFLTKNRVHDHPVSVRRDGAKESRGGDEI